MKLTDITRQVLQARRMALKMELEGYERIEGPWEIMRGRRYEESIVDAIIDIGGKSVWVKTASTPSGE